MTIAENTIQDEPEENLLEVRNLRTYYYTLNGIVKAVDDISFEIRQGEIAAIVGESGCGKSASAFSILNLIPNPGKITGGEVLFRGTNILSSNDKELRKIRGKEIAMIFQDASVALNPVLTVGFQLTECIYEHLGLNKEEAVSLACEILNQVGISNPKERLNQYPHQLSGGIKQRVMIAMALSCRPKLIIADEPTTALDVTIQAQILELMKNLCRQLKIAFIIITHNLGIVARYADMVYVMYAGHIVEEGITEEIYRDPVHPYTKGLLNSVPRLDLPKKEFLETIEGQPPNLISPPTGCAFHPRCKYCADKCRKEYPPLEKMNGSDTHKKACWLPVEEREKIG